MIDDIDRVCFHILMGIENQNTLSALILHELECIFDQLLFLLLLLINDRPFIRSSTDKFCCDICIVRFILKMSPCSLIN